MHSVLYFNFNCTPFYISIFGAGFCVILIFAQCNSPSVSFIMDVFCLEHQLESQCSMPSEVGKTVVQAAASMWLKGMTCMTSLLPSFFSIMLLLCAKRWQHCPSSSVSSQLIAYFPSALNRLIICQGCTSYCLCLGKQNHNNNNQPWKGISTVICSWPFSLLKKCHYEEILSSYVFKKDLFLGIYFTIEVSFAELNHFQYWWSFQGRVGWINLETLLVRMSSLHAAELQKLNALEMHFKA